VELDAPLRDEGDDDGTQEREQDRDGQRRGGDGVRGLGGKEGEGH
jgi:hypothetical protein